MKLQQQTFKYFFAGFLGTLYPGSGEKGAGGDLVTGWALKKLLRNYGKATAVNRNFYNKGLGLQKGY
jgi:hypothetical protein